MGICRIQKPSGSNNNAHHGNIYADITCNDLKGEEYTFEATKGDLRLHLICEEVDANAFYIGNIDDLLEEIKEKILALDTETEEIKMKLDLSEFENYMINNPINMGN